jgi:hypothetical protein
MKTLNLRGVLSDADLKTLRERNAARLRKTKDDMQEKYLLHPTNRVPRKDASPSLK